MKNIIFDGKIIRVCTENITLKNGSNLLLETVELRPSVHIIPITPEGNILLLDEYKQHEGTKRSPRVIAGLVDAGEDGLLAAKREAKEEAGIEGGNWELFYTASSRGAVKDVREYYIVRDCVIGEAIPDENEEIYGLFSFSPKEIEDYCLSGAFGTSPTPLVLLMLLKKLKTI